MSLFFFREEHDRLADLEDNLIKMDDLEFFQNLRISKDCFEFLIEKIGQGLQSRISSQQGGREPISVRKTLYIGLTYLCNNSCYREISQDFDVTRSKAHAAVSFFIKELVSLHKEVIRWPSTPQEFVLEEAEFLQLSQISGTIGAIDGCHIKIKASDRQQKAYLNRNHYHSVNLMAVCNSQMRFTFISAGSPGSLHDQRVLQLSPLWSKIESTEANNLFPSGHYHILGDSAFKLMENLMVPYKDHGSLTVQQTQFNTELSQARRLVENSFGWLKNRFKRLQGLDVKQQKFQDVIVACVILHNISLDFTNFETYLELIDDNVSTEPSLPIGGTLNSSQRGTAKRNRLANALL